MKGSTRAVGVSVLKLVVFINGLRAQPIRVNGKTADDMVLVLNTEAIGYIKENGLLVIKEDTALDVVIFRRQGTKVLGQTACKMDTDLRHMLMEDISKVFHQSFPLYLT